MPDVLIADDHPLFRDALRRAVITALPDAQTHCADSVHALLGLIEQYPEADLLLLDLHMPGARGYSALAHIRGQYPGLPTIVVSGHEEAQVARRALAHGASGYIPKSTPGDEIVKAIHAVLEGDTWLPHQLVGGEIALKNDEADIAARVASLTPQQFRVLTMIAEGQLNKQIAWDLGAGRQPAGGGPRCDAAAAGRRVRIARFNRCSPACAAARPATRAGRRVAPACAAADSPARARAASARCCRRR
jgi:DNA-binding NarL/FixJ family response regulator